MKGTNKMGFTLVEMMVGLSVGMLVASAACGTYLLYEGYMRRTGGQMVMGTTGRIAMDRMAREIRSAYNASTSNAGATLKVVRDPNRTHSDSSDDITSEFKLQGTDLAYDPDVTKTNDDFRLVKDVYPIYVDGLFRVSARRVRIAFVTYERSGGKRIEFESKIRMRNK